MRILVFGDSITQGFWDTEGGWVGHISRYYIEQTIKTQNYNIPTIFNLGVSGDTSNEVLARFENEVKARLWPGEEIVIIISTGVNDCYIKAGKKCF